MSRILMPGLCLFALLVLGIAAPAQDLKDIAARDKIQIEKLTQEVKDAVDFSRRQDPTDARQSLQRMINQVKESSVPLSATQRSDLVRRLQSGIAGVPSVRTGSGGGTTKSPPRDPDSPKPRPTTEPGRGVSDAAKSFQSGTKDAAMAHSETIKKREIANLKVLNSSDNLVLVMADPIAFPPYWKELTERRKKSVDQQMTDKESKLLKALNSTMSVDYKDDKFKAVIGHIMDKTGLTIIMDEASLRDQSIDYEADTVTFEVKKATVRTILKKVLGDKGLTYIIKEGTLQVMTPKKASEHTVVRSYAIDDLVSVSPQTQRMFGPFVAQMQMQKNAQQLASMIASTVSPDYWQPNGPGVIVFEPLTKSLIIRASAEMHYQLASPGLFGGR